MSTIQWKFNPMGHMKAIDVDKGKNIYPYYHSIKKYLHHCFDKFKSS